MKKILIIAGLMISATWAVPILSQNTARNEVTISEHQVDPFTSIEVGGSFNVILQKGETPKVRVETNEHLQRFIEVYVENNTLFIRTSGMRNPTKLNVYVTYTSLEHLDVSGAAEISSEQPVESDRLTIDLSGASSVDLAIKTRSLTTSLLGASKARLTGEATLHNAKASGATDLQAAGLITQTTNINLSGASIGNITTTDAITYDVSGAASLKYTKNGVTSKVDATRRAYEAVKTDTLQISETEIITEQGDTIRRIRIGNVDISIQERDPDTIDKTSRQILVEVEGDIEVVEEDENKRENFDGHWAGVYLGINGYTTAARSIDMPIGYDFLDLQYEKSINLQVNFLEQNLNLIDNKLGLVTGLGFEWNNYRFANNIRLDHTKPTLVGFAHTLKNFTKSKMVVRWLNVPLILEFNRNHEKMVNRFHIAAGVVGGVRIGSHTKMASKNGERVIEKTHERFHLSPLKADATIRFGWGLFNFYANYSLTSLFAKDKAPELFPFTLGVSLLNF